MRVQSSHLALRFYECDGWTEEVLKSCLAEGDNMIERTGGDGWWYWRLKVYSNFDVEKLMKHITEVDRWYKGDKYVGQFEETDREYVQGMNW